MVKTIRKMAHLAGIVFDAALMKFAHLKVGDKVNVEVHAGGTITLTPLRAHPSQAEVSNAVKSTMKHFSRTMKKLARS